MASARSRRFSFRPSAEAQQARPKPTVPRVWAPTITFSSTESAGNSARFWKVRAMPTRAMPVRRQRRAGRAPSKVIEPALAARRGG